MTSRGPACACGPWAQVLALLGLATAETRDALSAEITRARADVDALARDLARLAEQAYAHAPVVRIHQTPPPR